MNPEQHPTLEERFKRLMEEARERKRTAVPTPRYHPKPPNTHLSHSSKAFELKEEETDRFFHPEN